MRRFKLVWQEGPDAGAVGAEGVRFSDGVTAIRWLRHHATELLDIEGDDRRLVAAVERSYLRRIELVWLDAQPLRAQPLGEAALYLVPGGDDDPT